MRTRPPASMPAPPAFRLSAETCRLARWPRATRGTRSRRQKASACRFCLLVVGRFGPRRAKKKAMRNGRNANLRFPAHHPKSAKRTRVLLNTPHSTGLVSTTLHKAGSLLRQDQDRSGRAFGIRAARMPIPLSRRSGNPPHFSADAFAPRAADRCGSGFAGPRFGRFAPRNVFNNLRIQSINQTPIAHASPPSPLCA